MKSCGRVSLVGSGISLSLSRRYPLSAPRRALLFFFVATEKKFPTRRRAAQKHGGSLSSSGRHVKSRSTFVVRDSRSALMEKRHTRTTTPAISAAETACRRQTTRAHAAFWSAAGTHTRRRSRGTPVCRHNTSRGYITDVADVATSLPKVTLPPSATAAPAFGRHSDRNTIAQLGLTCGCRFHGNPR